MANVEIRDFTPEDKDVYLDMSRAFYQSNAVLHPVPEEYFSRTFDMCVEASPYVRGLMLLKDGAVAGYALLSFTWSCEAGGLCVLLEEAYILPAFQGSGLGSAFLRFVEDSYADKAKRLRLEVTHSNKGAVRLYERMGYQKIDYLQMVKDY